MATTLRKTLRSLGLAALGAGLAFSPAGFAGAANTGSVSGTILVKKAVVDVAGPKSDKDVVVYLLPKAPGAPAAPAEHAKMDQSGLNFMPHVLAVQKGSTVDFLNHDQVNHNVSSPAACCVFNLGQWGKGEVKSHRFDQEGVAPLQCNLHPEMAASIVVLDTPYFTTASLPPPGKDNRQSVKYSIKGVPPGDYTLKVWHGKLIAANRQVKVGVGAAASVDIDLRKK